jgi:hypothetical protein
MKINYKYIWVLIISLLVLVVAFYIENKPNPPKDEYYWSHLVKDCLTQYVRIIFALIGFLACYFLKLNPWITAICVFAVFPIITLIEGIIYKGSHNLIPFELVVFVFLSLPTVVAGYLGKWLMNKRTQSNNTLN